MSEPIQLKEPLYRLSVRFGNGELLQYLVNEPIDSRLVTPDVRYAIITSVSTLSPNELAETMVINLRDLTYIKSERVTLDQLASEHRSAGIRNTSGDDAQPKTLSRVKFI
ncbi:MAG TPA: hypothetical protein VJX67_00700 [Blastocatellia bacterium]|nr:hypothetical protein [Blastocatellia bacterium]